MTMDPANETNVEAALSAVLKAAEAARWAPDLATAKQALNRVWFDVHKATETINAAEAATRQAALAKVRTFA